MRLNVSDSEDGGVEVNDGFSPNSINLFAVSIQNTTAGTGANYRVYKCDEVPYVTSVYKCSYLLDGRWLAGLALINPILKLSVIYLPTDYISLTQSAVYTQKIGTNLCENVHCALVDGVDELAPFRNLSLGLDARKELLKQKQYYEMVTIGKEPVQLTNISEVFQFCERLPRSKISQEHHIHYSAVDACNAFKVKYGTDVTVKFFNSLASMSDITVTAVSGIVIYVASLSYCIGMSLIDSGVFSYYSSMNEWYNDRKKYSNDFKVNANTTRHSLEQFFEIEVLVNRLNLGIDWESEMINRTDVNVTRFTSDEVYSKAVKLFKTAASSGKAPLKQNWDTFWKKRWEWSTTGATNMPYAEYSQDLKYPSWNAKTKFLTYLQMKSDLTAEELLNNVAPAVIAKPSVKYEWGKTRAIYGCDDISHLIYTFTMGTPEELLPNWIPLGKSSSENYVTSLYRQVSREGYSLCLDFEDFNSQHSTESMLVVLKAYFDVYASQLTPSQQSFIPWIMTSVTNQIVTGGASGSVAYKTNGTLFSGWRLTTFMNTVLNYCYTDLIVQKSGAVCYGSLHSGDDVFMTVGSAADYLSMQNVCDIYNVRLSKNKCFFGTIKEFLRKDRKHGAGVQYLARGVSTLVHGRTESSQHSDIIEMLKSNETRLSEIYNRGGDTNLINNLRGIYISRLRNQGFYGDLSEEVIDHIYTSHPVNYGINTEAPAKGIITDLNVQSGGKLVDIDLPGVRDYVALLKHYLNDSGNVKRLYNSVYKATERVCFSNMTRVIGLKSSDLKERQMMKALYKVYSRVKVDIHYGKARLIGLDCVNRDLLNNIAVLDKVIGDRDNFYEWLSVLV